MLYTKIQPQNVLGWQKGLSVLRYMAMEAVLFNGPEPFKQIVNTFLTEDPTWILVIIAQAVSELHSFIHVYSPGAKADNP